VGLVFVEKLVVSGVELLDDSRVAYKHVTLMANEENYVHDFPIAQKVSAKSEGWAIVITSNIRHLLVLIDQDQVSDNGQGSWRTDYLVRLALVVPFHLIKLHHPRVEVVRQPHPQQSNLDCVQ